MSEEEAMLCVHSNSLKKQTALCYNDMFSNSDDFSVVDKLKVRDTRSQYTFRHLWGFMTRGPEQNGSGEEEGVCGLAAIKLWQG